MKTAIIEVEETKKFKPFAIKITFETAEEAKEFCAGLRNASGKCFFDIGFIVEHRLNMLRAI